jgi:hypothetical protein
MNTIGRGRLLLGIVIASVAPPAVAQTASTDTPGWGSVFVFTPGDGPVDNAGWKSGPLEARFREAVVNGLPGMVADDVVLMGAPEGAPGRTATGTALRRTTCSNGKTLQALADVTPAVCEHLASLPPVTGDRIAMISSTDPFYDSDGGYYLETQTGWLQLAFAQRFALPSGMHVVLTGSPTPNWTTIGSPDELRGTVQTPSLDEEKTGVFGVAGDSVADFRDGYRRVMAPGTSLIQADGRCVRIKPAMSMMDRFNIAVVGTPLPTPEKIKASIKANGCPDNSPPPPPWWGFVLLFGIPLAVISGIVWIVRRLLRARKGGGPRITGTLPAGGTPPSAAVDGSPPPEIGGPPKSD